MDRTTNAYCVCNTEKFKECSIMIGKQHYCICYDEKHQFECVKGHKFAFDGREFIRRQTHNTFCTYCDGKKVDYDYLVRDVYDQIKHNVDSN